MMDRMMSGMGVMVRGMGMLWLLVFIALVLAAAALVKHLLSHGKR